MKERLSSLAALLAVVGSVTADLSAQTVKRHAYRIGSRVRQPDPPRNPGRLPAMIEAAGFCISGTAERITTMFGTLVLLWSRRRRGGGPRPPALPA